MKKVKVTKRPKTQTEFVLKPNRLRMFLIYMVLFILAYGVGTVLRYILTGGDLDLERMGEDWLIDVLIVFGGPVLLALLDYNRWVIKYQENQLEGLSGAFGERSVFPIREIDWKRTARSLSSRVKIGNGIYAQTSRRILISPWFYNPGDYKTFLDLIGYDKGIRAPAA